MKLDTPHEHLPPAPNHAAVSLSHEAFAPHVAAPAAARPVEMPTPKPMAPTGEHHMASMAPAPKIEPPCPPAKMGAPVGRAPEAPIAPVAAVMPHRPEAPMTPPDAGHLHGGHPNTGRPPEAPTAPAAPHQSFGHGGEKAPCPPGQKPEAPKPPHETSGHKPEKTPCPPEKAPHAPKPPHETSGHKPEKTPCPPEKAPHAPKPPHETSGHKPEKTPCPPEKAPHAPKPPHQPGGHHHDKTPCPPAKPPEVTPPTQTVPPAKPPEVTPPTQTVPPAKPPEVAPPVAPPTVSTPPVETPPVVVVPPRQPFTPPVFERYTPVRYSPPAEMIRPLKGSDYFAAPEKATVVGIGKIEVPTGAQGEATTSQATAETVTREITTGAAAREGKYKEVGHKEVAVGKGHGTTTFESHGAGTTVTAAAKVENGATSGKGVVVREHATAAGDKHSSVQLAGEVTETASVATVETAQAVASTSTEVVVASPSAEAGTVPQQDATKKNWAEATMSYSPHYKTTVGTATVGHFFNDQNYGYVQGTYDATHHQTADVSVMYGHSVLSPYDADGNPRRGNVNVEAGVTIKNGPALEGSKIPVLGGNGVRVGVSGYYNLDKEGKTSLYGGADYASSPKQADIQAGVSHQFTDKLAVSGGYEVSKVQGYRTSQFVTTSVSLKLNDSTEVYTGAAVSNHKDENRVYAGVRFRF